MWTAAQLRKGGEMMENKQRILDLLLPALRATRNLHDLWDLRYDPKTDTVTAVFENGSEKHAHVAMDSGTSMIRDVIGQIT